MVIQLNGWPVSASSEHPVSMPKLPVGLGLKIPNSFPKLQCLGCLSWYNVANAQVY